MSWMKTTGRRALERTFAGLNRADEIGGEIRDYIQERVLVDERYVRLRKRAAALRGKTYTSRAEAAAAAQVREEVVARAAPAPGAGEKPVKKGLGDSELPAQIYGRKSCPWSGRAIRLLEDLKVDYDLIDLDEPEHGHYEGRLVAETKQNTVPYIFVRGQFLGGFNALSEVHRLGQLDALLLSQEERAEAGPAAQKIVVVPRPNTDESAPGESA